MAAEGCRASGEGVEAGAWIMKPWIAFDIGVLVAGLTVAIMGTILNTMVRRLRTRKR